MHVITLKQQKALQIGDRYHRQKRCTVFKCIKLYLIISVHLDLFFVTSMFDLASKRQITFKDNKK